MSTNNWLDFANDDIEVGDILFREAKYNMTCFHSQQAAEKALKGFLTHHKLASPRTHNLVELINLCNKIDSGFASCLKWQLSVSFTLRQDTLMLL